MSQQASKQLQQQASRPSNLTVFLSNLPANIAASSIDEVFHNAGYQALTIELVKKGCGSHMKTCGLGLVILKEGTNLDAVIEDLDGKPLWGRPVIVRKDKFVEDNASYEHVSHPAPAAPTRTTARAALAH